MRHDGDRVIERLFKVTRPDIAAAKAWLARNQFREPRDAVNRWLATNGYHGPIEPVPLWKDDVEPDLAQIARRLSLQAAAFTAVWELLNSSRLAPSDQLHLTTEEPRVTWTTVRPHGSGGTGHWVITAATVTYFNRVVGLPQAAGPYTDGDLFLAEVGIPDIHEGVARALKEAAACFRHDLYTPCVAMLGAAAEGAWIELGEALLPVYASGSSGDKYTATLRSQASVTTKVDVVQKMWGANPLCEVRSATGIGTERLALAAEWTDTVRRSRNVLHWGVEATTPNAYDKVATMVLTTPNHLRTLYDARRAALEFVRRKGAS